jgi:hypothetical protein
MLERRLVRYRYDAQRRVLGLPLLTTKPCQICRDRFTPERSREFYCVGCKPQSSNWLKKQKGSAQ